MVCVDESRVKGSSIFFEHWLKSMLTVKFSRPTYTVVPNWYGYLAARKPGISGWQIKSALCEVQHPCEETLRCLKDGEQFEPWGQLKLIKMSPRSGSAVMPMHGIRSKEGNTYFLYYFACDVPLVQELCFRCSMHIQSRNLVPPPLQQCTHSLHRLKPRWRLIS